MARWTYAFSNGSYNDWHRKYDNIAMIDIDSIECCPKCYEPLAILETCYDKGQIYKATTLANICLLYTSPSPRDGLLSRMPSSA